MREFPGARPAREIWTLTRDPLRAISEGEIAVAIDAISIDPGMSGWITDKRSYMPPVKPGGVMRAFGVGKVIESKTADFEAGDWVTGFTGVQTHGVYRAEALRKIDTSLAPPEKFLSGLGMTGYTGYFGMSDLGQPKAGETVVVSAASGAVGSIAAQVAKAAGARVIGIAGGPVKCAYLLDDLGLDAVIDYKNSDVDEALAHLPNLRTVWMQLEIFNAAARAKAEAREIEVVEDRCPAIEYPRLIGTDALAELVG